MSASLRIRPERDFRPAREPAAQIALVSKLEVARALGISVWTLDRWRKLGKLPKPIRLTDRSPMMWRLRDVDAWIMKRQVARIPPAPLRGIAAVAKAQKEKRERQAPLRPLRMTDAATDD